MKIFCNGKTYKISFVYGLFESPLGQIIFVQAKKMSQLVQKSLANLFTKNILIIFCKIPQIPNKKNDLRRQHRCAIIRKLRAIKNPKCFWRNTIRLQSSIWRSLKGDRQFLRLFAQWQRQLRQRRLNFFQRQFLQSVPICIHAAILSVKNLHGKFSLALERHKFSFV